MRKYIRHYDVANEISMRRSVEKEVFVVVEGITDYRLYGKFTDEQNCKLAIAHSKSNVRLSVKELVKDRGDDMVSGIVDADYDRINGADIDPPVFITDAHDLETMIFHSTALEHILWEYGDQDKIQDFENRRGMGIREAILNACYPIGTLMYLSLKNNYELNFRDMNYHDFINPSTLILDLDRFVTDVHSNSKFGREKKKSLLRNLNQELAKKHDPWQMCRGHDMADVLILGFQHSFGSYNSRALNHGALQGSLRLAYHREHFQDTDLFQGLGSWGHDRDLNIWKF